MKRKKGGKKRDPYLVITMGPGKNEYKKRFKWLLDFLNADIDNLSVKGFLTMFHDYLVFLFGVPLPVYAEERTVKSICQDTDLNRQQLVVSQQIFREETDRLLSEFESIRSGATLISLEDNVSFSYYLHFDGRVILRPNIGIFPKDLKDDSRYETTTVSLSYFSAFNIETAIKYFLYSLLEKVSLHSIFRCPDCHGFFKKTQRKKSPLCRKCLQKQTVYKWRGSESLGIAEKEDEDSDSGSLES